MKTISPEVAKELAEALLQAPCDCVQWEGVVCRRCAALAKFDAEQVARSGTTHSEECWRWHHDCAVAKIEREAEQGKVAEPVARPWLADDGLTAEQSRALNKAFDALEALSEQWAERVDLQRLAVGITRQGVDAVANFAKLAWTEGAYEGRTSLIGIPANAVAHLTKEAELVWLNCGPLNLPPDTYLYAAPVPAPSAVRAPTVVAAQGVTEEDVQLGVDIYYRNCSSVGHRDAGAMRAVLKYFIATRAQQGGEDARDGCHGLDTPERVRFYEHDFYPLSNFSAFNVTIDGQDFDTSEAAYHWYKFPDSQQAALAVMYARSAHEAFKTAESNKHLRRADWDDVKVGVMRRILRAKVDQHEYVRRKLLATGERELVEDSWRDDFWGWGPNRDGKNMLGKLWMELRAELRAAIAAKEGEG